MGDFKIENKKALKKYLQGFFVRINF